MLLGTLLSVDKVETDKQDFESGLGAWNSSGLKIVNPASLPGLQTQVLLSSPLCCLY